MAEAVDVVAKKWGSSIGIVIPKEIVEKEHIKENQKLTIDIKKPHILREIYGSLKGWKIDSQKAKDEMRKGWE